MVLRDAALEGMEMNRAFWRGKKVLITGHTGFKGSWLSLWLQQKGAQLVGFALPPPTQPSLFELARVGDGMETVTGDISEPRLILDVMRRVQPEIVFHMAAQPLVQFSYQQPVETYRTNVMGTVHLLEAVRQTPGVRAVVVVTSDKCYENKNWHWPYREFEPMGGRDPYASSKGCSELVTAAYRTSFFGPESDGKYPGGVATARAGNVIGGGDWTPGRLVPDVMKSLLAGQNVALRMVGAVRPWQHVLEPLGGYQLLAERLWENPASCAEAWNFGPREESNQPVAWLVEQLLNAWGGEQAWRPDTEVYPHEDRMLKLDSSKAFNLLNWSPRLSLVDTLRWIVEWYRVLAAGGDIRQITEQQIRRFEERT